MDYREVDLILSVDMKPSWKQWRLTGTVDLVSGAAGGVESSPALYSTSTNPLLRIT